jgi:hypothetical protein
VQAEMDRGNETVRAPRLALVGAERDEALALIRERLSCRPTLSSSRLAQELTGSMTAPTG